MNTCRVQFHTPTTGAVLAKNQNLRSYSQTGPKRYTFAFCMQLVSLGKGLQRFPLSKSDPQDPQTSTNIQNNLPNSPEFSISPPKIIDVSPFSMDFMCFFKYPLVNIHSLLLKPWPNQNREFSHENSMVDLSSSLCNK